MRRGGAAARRNRLPGRQSLARREHGAPSGPGGLRGETHPMSTPRATPDGPEKRAWAPADAPAGGTGAKQDVPADDGPSAVPPATATAPAGAPAHLEPAGAPLLTARRR